MTSSSAYWLQSGNQGFSNFATWTSSSSTGDPYPTVTAKLNSDMKHLRAGMFSMLTASQISQISQPWAIPLNYWTGQYFTGSFAPTTLSFAKKTRVDFNFNLLRFNSEQTAISNISSYEAGTGGRFYMEDIFNYANSGSAGQQVTSLPSSDGAAALTGNYQINWRGGGYYWFGPSAGTGFADTFRVNVRSADKVAITGITSGNWALLGSWMDNAGTYLNIGDRILSSSGIESSPWAYNFFQYFASSNGNIDADESTRVIRFLSAAQVSYIGTKAGTISQVSTGVRVKASDWTEVGVTFLGDLSGLQLSLVSNLHTFSNVELAALTPGQISSGFISQDWSTLSASQLNLIPATPGNAATNTFAFLRDEAYTGLSVAALGGLDAVHVAQISLRAFDTMSIQKINAMGALLGSVAGAGLASHLSNSKLNQLGSSFFGGLTNGDFLNALTITQLGQIPASAFGQLSNAAVAGINATTLARLSDAQLGAISNQQYLTKPNGLLLRSSTSGIDMAKLVSNQQVDWSRITYYFLNQLSQANFNLLTPAIWKQIPSSVLGRLTLAQTQRLGQSALTALSDNQFGALKFVGLISTSLVKKVFTGSRVSGLRPYSFWSYVTPAMFNALSTKTETINGVAYSNVVARIPVAAISQLPVSVFSNIDTAHLEAFTNSQLANLTPNQFAAIDASKFLPYTDADGVVHPSRILTQVSLNTFKALQPTQIRRLYEFLFNTVDTNAFANVSEEEATANKEAFATLLGRIMDGDDGREKWLGNAVNMLLDLNWLDADVVANIDLEQIQSDKYMNINWGWMSAKFLNSISTDVFGALKASNVVQINLTAMAGLDAAHIAALSATQVSVVYAIDGRQVAGLTAAQLSAMSSIDSLQPETVAAIAPNVLAAVSFNLAQRSSAFLNALTAQQYAALSGVQLAQFSNEQLTTLPIDWSVMGADALNGLSSTQFRALCSGADPQLLMCSAQAFAGLDAAHWVDLALSVESLSTSQVSTLRQQLLNGLLPTEAQALIKGMGSDILSLQVLEIAQVRQLATLNPEGENQYATALSAVLAMRSQFADKWTTGNVALLLSQLQFNIRRGNNLQVDSAPSAYYYTDIFDRQINQLAMLPLQSPTETSGQIGSLVGPYLAFIQGVFEPLFLTASFNGPDGFAQTQDASTYEEHLLQALLRFEDKLGKAPYTLYSLQEIDTIVSAAYDDAQHDVTTTGADWNSLGDGERYRLVGQAMESELLDKASVKMLAAAGQTSINNTLLDSAEMLSNLGTVMVLVQLANDPGSSIGSTVVELNLSEADRAQYLGAAIYAALQQLASETRQSVSAVGENLGHYLSGLGVQSSRLASQFSSFKTHLRAALGQKSLDALLGSAVSLQSHDGKPEQDLVEIFASLQSRLGVDLKKVLLENLGISYAEGSSLSTAQLMQRFQVQLLSEQNNLNAWNQRVLDLGYAMQKAQSVSWSVGELNKTAQYLMQSVAVKKMPTPFDLAFFDTTPKVAVQDIVDHVLPQFEQMRVLNVNPQSVDSPWNQLIRSGPLFPDWFLLQSEIDSVDGSIMDPDRPITDGAYGRRVGGYETEKLYIRALYARNGVHVSEDQVQQMVDDVFVRRFWENVGTPENVQRCISPSKADGNAVFIESADKALAEVFGMDRNSFTRIQNGQAGSESVDSGWANLKTVDRSLFNRLSGAIFSWTDDRATAVGKIVAQSLKASLQQQPQISSAANINGAADAGFQLREFFYTINKDTPILAKQGSYTFAAGKSMAELYFHSQGNVLDSTVTTPGVDLPAPVQKVLLSALRDAAVNGYFDADPATPLSTDINSPFFSADMNMTGKSIIETPEVIFARLVKLIDPDVFYNTVGVEFAADLPAPGGGTVHKTLSDLRVGSTPTHQAGQAARGKAAAQEVIRLTGSEEAAYNFLNKGRSGTAVTVQYKYSQQFLEDAFQEVYKGVLESYLQTHPNPDPDTMEGMVRGLIRMSNNGGKQTIDTETGEILPNPIPGEDQISNILTRGYQSDGYGTSNHPTVERFSKIADPKFVMGEDYRNGLTSGFTKAVRSVVFGAQAEQFDTLIRAHLAGLAQDYVDTVAVARSSGGVSSAPQAQDFMNSRVESMYNQSLRETFISETFFEQCKAFDIVPANAELDSMTVFEFRHRLLASSQGLNPNEYTQSEVRSVVVRQTVQQAISESGKRVSSLTPGEANLPASERNFRLAVLGGHAELTSAESSLARRVLSLARSNSINDLRDAAYAVIDDPGVTLERLIELVNASILEEERMALNGQRVRPNNSANPVLENLLAEPDLPLSSVRFGPGGRSALANTDEYMVPDALGSNLRVASPGALRRIATSLVRGVAEQHETYTPQELKKQILIELKKARLLLPNGIDDIDTITREFYTQSDHYNNLRLTAAQEQALAEHLGVPAIATAGTSANSEVDSVVGSDTYTPILNPGAATPEPQPQAVFGSTPANSIVLGAAAYDVPGNAVLQKNAQVRQAVVSMDKFLSRLLPQAQTAVNELPPESVLPELMRLSLSTWLDDSDTQRSAHIDEYLRTQGVEPEPDFIAQISETLDQSLGDLFEVTLGSHEQGLSPAQRAALQAAGFEYTSSGWSSDPGIEWRAVFDTMFSPSVVGKEPSVRTAFAKKIFLRIAQMSTQETTASLGERASLEILTRQFADNLAFYSGDGSDVSAANFAAGAGQAAPTGERNLLGDLPIEPQQLDDLRDFIDDAKMYDEPDAPRPTAEPQPRAVAARSEYDFIGGDETPVVVAGNSSKLKTAVKGFFSRLKAAVLGTPATPETPVETPAQVQLVVASEAEEIFTALDNKNHPSWAEPDSRKFQITARQMAQAYNDAEGPMVPGQGHASLREGIVQYLRDQYGSRMVISEDLVDSYFNALRAELGDNLRSVDASILPSTVETVSSSELGSVMLTGTQRIANAVVNNRPMEVFTNLLNEVETLQLSFVPSSRSDGTAEPVYDFLSEFLGRVSRLEIPDSMSVPDLLDQVRTVANAVSTEQGGGLTQLTDMLDTLRQIHAAAPDPTALGQTENHLKVVEALKKLTTEIGNKIGSATPEQMQRVEQARQLAVDVEAGVSAVKTGLEISQSIGQIDQAVTTGNGSTLLNGLKEQVQVVADTLPVASAGAGNAPKTLINEFVTELQRLASSGFYEHSQGDALAAAESWLQNKSGSSPAEVLDVINSMKAVVQKLDGEIKKYIADPSNEQRGRIIRENLLELKDVVDTLVAKGGQNASTDVKKVSTQVGEIAQNLQDVTPAGALPQVEPLPGGVLDAPVPLNPFEAASAEFTAQSLPPIVSDPDVPPPLPSRSVLTAADFVELGFTVEATSSRGTLAEAVADSVPVENNRTLGGSGNGNGNGRSATTHLPTDSDQPQWQLNPNEDGTYDTIPAQTRPNASGRGQDPIYDDIGAGLVEMDQRVRSGRTAPNTNTNGADDALPARNGTGGASLLAAPDPDAPALPPSRNAERAPTPVRTNAQGEIEEILTHAPTAPSRKMQLSRWARINNSLEASPTFKTAMNVTNVVMGVLGFLLSVAGLGMSIYGIVGALRNRNKMTAFQFATAMVMGAGGIVNSAIALTGIAVGVVAVVAAKAALTAVATAAETVGKVFGVLGASLGVAMSLAGLGLSVLTFNNSSEEDRDAAIAGIAYAVTQTTIALVGLAATLAVCAAAGPIGWVVGIVVAVVALLIPNFQAIVQAVELEEKGDVLYNQQLWGEVWVVRAYYDIAQYSSAPVTQLGAAGWTDYIADMYKPFMTKKWFDFEAMLEQEYAFLSDAGFVTRMDGVARSINYKEISSLSTLNNTHQTLTHAYSLMITQQELKFWDSTDYTNTVRQAYITEYSSAPVRRPVLYSASVDGTQLTLRFDRQMGGLDGMEPLKEQFSVTVAGTAVVVTKLVINGDGDVVLTLPNSVTQGQVVTFSYTAPTASNETHALQDPAGYRAGNVTNHAVQNRKDSSQAAPKLVDAYFTSTYVRLVFDQLLDTDGAEISTDSFSVNAYLNVYLEAQDDTPLYLPVGINSVQIKGQMVELELERTSNNNISLLRGNYALWASGNRMDVSYNAPSSHAIKSVSENGGLKAGSFTVSNHVAGEDSAKPNVNTDVVLVCQAADFNLSRTGYVNGSNADHSVNMNGLPSGKLVYDHSFDWTISRFAGSAGSGADVLAEMQEKMTVNGNSDQVFALETDANSSKQTRYLQKSNAAGELNYLSVSATKLAKDTFYLDARGSLGQNTIALDTKGTTALGGWGGNTFSLSRNLADSLYASVQNPGQDSANVVNISGAASDSNTLIDLDHLVHSHYILPRASFRVYGSSDGLDRIVGTSDYQAYFSNAYNSDIELWGDGAQVSIGSATTTKLHGDNAQVLLDLALWYMFGKNPDVAAAQSTGTVQGNFGASSVINLSSTNFGEGLDGHVNFSNSVAQLPAASAFAVRVNGNAPGASQQTDTFGTSVGVKSVRVSGNSVILTLNQAVSSGQWVGLSYTRPSGSSDVVQDLLGNVAASFTAATSATDSGKLINRSGANLKPAVTLATVSGNTVTLRFDEALQSNTALLPPLSAFTVMVNDVAVKVTALSIVDNRVQLTLDYTTLGGDRVDVGYRDILDTQDDDAAVLQSINSGLDVATLAVRAYNVLTSSSAPVLQDATINGTLLALGFSDRLDPTRIPVNSDYSVLVNNQAVSVSSVLVKDSGVLLTLDSAVAPGAVVRLAYTPGSSEGTLRGLSGRAVLAWEASTVFNQTGIDASPPLLQGAQLAGNTLTLAFSEALDITPQHLPDQSVFAVSVDGVLVPVQAVAFSSNQITLTLDSSVEGDQLVRVGYTPSNSQPHLRDRAGLELARFSGVSVRNFSRDISAPVIRSAVVNGNVLTITFSEFLDLEHLPQLESLRVQIGAQQVSLVNSDIQDNVLTLSLGVAALPGSVVTLGYTQTPNSDNNFQDSSGNKVETVSNRAVVNITGKDIDAPALIEAIVSGSQLVLTLSENLVTDALHLPGLSSFSVQVNGAPVSLAASNALTVSNNTVTLTLANAVSASDLVKVSYSLPAIQTQGLFDLSGNATYAFSTSASNHTLLDAPVMQTMAVDGYNLLISYDQDLDATAGGLPPASAFSVEVRSSPTAAGTLVKVSTVVAYNKNLMLTLAEPVARDSTVLLSYTKPVINATDTAAAAKTGYIRNNDNVKADSIAATTVLNLTDTAQLQTVKVNGTDLSFVLSQPLSLLDADLPVLSSFEVKVDGVSVTPTAITLSPFGGTLTLPTAVTSAQSVTLAYTNSSTLAGNTETHWLRDFFGYTVGNFSAKTAINITPLASKQTAPSLVQSIVDGDQVILTYDRLLATAEALMQMNFAVDSAVDASGKPLQTGKVNASGFLNFLGSNNNGDTYDLGDQSQVAQSQRLVYLQLGSGRDNVVTYRDTTGMVLSPSATGNASIYVMPNAALTLYSTLEQDAQLRPILKDKADDVLLYAGTSLQGVLNGYENIDAREPTSTVSAEVGVGKHKFQFGGQSYGMVIDRVDSTTTIQSPLTPYDTQQGQLLEFKQSTTSEIYIGREADGTIVLDLHMLDAANQVHDAWVYYDGGTSNVRLNAYDPNDGTHKYMFNIDKLVETIGSVGLASDSAALANKRRITDASSLSGQNMNLYRITDVVKYNLVNVPTPAQTH